MVSRTLRLVLVASLTLSLVIAGIPGHTAAQSQPESADEFFEAFRSMEGADAFDRYSEFETIRSYAVSQAQTGDLSAQDRETLSAIHETLVAFQSAHQATTDGEHQRALENGDAVAAGIDAVATNDESLATLAELGLERFYGSVGADLYTASTNATATSTQIDQLSMAATAYERAEQPQKATEYEIQADQLAQELEADRSFIDAASEEAATVDCDDCETATASIGARGPGIFDAYLETRDANADVEDAERRASSHGLDERATELAATSTALDEQQRTLAIGAAAVLFGWGVVVGLVSSLLTARLRRWRRTVEAAQVDAVVPMGGRDA